MRIAAGRLDREQDGSEVQSRERDDPQGHSSAQAQRLSDTGVIDDHRRRNVCSSLRAAEVSPAVIEEYTCSICGVTLETCHQWGPKCPKTGRKVCAECCYRCDLHVSWSGIWRCSYISQEEKRAEARRKAQERFDAESRRISEAFYERRREEARKRASKAAKTRR